MTVYEELLLNVWSYFLLGQAKLRNPSPWISQQRLPLPLIFPSRHAGKLEALTLH